jgi:hypothetical protein
VKDPEGGVWFGGKPGEFSLFRVNRRPLPEDNLFAPEGMPSDVFQHFAGVLAPGYEIVTGQRFQRVWRVGGVTVDESAKMVLGKLGWVPLGEEVVPAWSEKAKDWVASYEPSHGGSVVPFGFDGETRLLAVLNDRRSQPTTVGVVFERILRDNEEQLIDRTTEWSVEAHPRRPKLPLVACEC